MKKPAATAIRRSLPLTSDELRGDVIHCNICGEESWGDLAGWREHDELDRPIPGRGALVFIDVGHPLCEKEMTDHLRLYEPDPGEPGAFPGLCGDCVYRNGLECESPLLKSNGGKGLPVHIDGGWEGMFICGDDGLIPVPRRARRCDGFSLVQLARSILTMGAQCDPSPKEQP